MFRKNAVFLKKIIFGPLDSYLRRVKWVRYKTVKHCWEADHSISWDQMKVVDRESTLIPRKIKETINFLTNRITLTKFPKFFLIYKQKKFHLHLSEIIPP